jgi:hypothetical protein
VEVNSRCIAYAPDRAPLPRADPARSPYCASRHLLRNLDDARALRRNPLARSFFESAGATNRADRDAERRALERVRAAVQLTLARWRERASSRGHVALGRMHAVLLRCDLDNASPVVVAAELGLSERQLRRERRAAHEEFLRAFASAPDTSPPACVSDVAALRLAQAVELHECGQSALALAACTAIAAAAPQPERRIEALCLAAEAELDAARFGATSDRIADANAILALHRDTAGAISPSAAEEQIDYVAWSLRRHTGTSGGFAMPPPLVVARADAACEADEGRRALLVRALAAYAMQRWEVGDVEHGLAAVRRATAVLGTLDTSRTKERLAVMFADVMLSTLREPPAAGRERFLAIQQSAERKGHARAMLAARKESICREADAQGLLGRAVQRLLGAYGQADRRTMALSYASAAVLAAQCDDDPRPALAAAHLTERLVAPRSMTAAVARLQRAWLAIGAGRYDEARVLAYAILDESRAIGNPRLQGGAARVLARLALEQGRQCDARRHIGEALPLLERYGTYLSLRAANAIARRLGVN